MVFGWVFEKSEKTQNLPNLVYSALRLFRAPPFLYDAIRAFHELLHCSQAPFLFFFFFFFISFFLCFCYFFRFLDASLHLNRKRFCSSLRRLAGRWLIGSIMQSFPHAIMASRLCRRTHLRSFGPRFPSCFFLPAKKSQTIWKRRI